MIIAITTLTKTNIKSNPFSTNNQKNIIPPVQLSAGGVGGWEARTNGACPEVRAQQKTSALNFQYLTPNPE